MAVNRDTLTAYLIYMYKKLHSRIIRSLITLKNTLLIDNAFSLLLGIFLY